MAFDGSYPRKIRESGVVHRIYVRRARCTKCGIGDALLPEFILGHRLDSATTIGAAVLTWVGHPVPDGASHLYERVPERTVRSWRQRFAERAEDLTARLYALCVEWGGVLPVFAPTPLRRAVQAIGATWAAARRRRSVNVPPAWPLANVILGSQLLSTRVDLPWPIVPAMIGRSRSP